MPRFYLHIHNSNGKTVDEEGQEVADVEAARATAIAGIRSVLADEILRGSLDLRGRIEIEDEAGAVRAVVAFSEALRLRLDREAA
jgi:hypothetical protein